MSPSAPSPMRPINYPAVATALDLGYRLTVAINVINHRLESWRWLVDWYEAIRFSMKELILATEPLRMGEERTQLVAKPVIDVYANMGRDALWLGSGGSNYREKDILREAGSSLVEIRKLIGRAIVGSSDCRPKKGESRKGDLLMCWFLGEQLAVDDLSAFIAYADVPGRMFTASPAFRCGKLPCVDDFDIQTLFEKSELQSTLAPFIDVVDNRIINNSCRARDEKLFTPGGLVRFLTAVWHPRFFSSVVWVTSDSDDEPPGILYAGRLFTGHGLIRPKKKRDFSFLDLLRVMADDKMARKLPDECGWVERKSFFGDKVSASLASHNWDAMAEFAAPIGELEYVKINKKAAERRPSSGMGRAPARLASEDCRIIWDE